MLGQRRRRWTNIKTTLVPCLVFSGATQQKPVIGSMLVLCWVSLVGGPTSSRHWAEQFAFSCTVTLLGLTLINRLSTLAAIILCEMQSILNKFNLKINGTEP